jgi:hypothetical protein
MRDISQRFWKQVHKLFIEIACNGGRRKTAIGGYNTVKLALPTFLDEIGSICCLRGNKLGDFA